MHIKNVICSCLCQSKLTFEYSIDRVIDDWVLMGFLVGNDFIPHLPGIHIHQDCLPLLWQTYKAVLPTLDGSLYVCCCFYRQFLIQPEVLDDLLHLLKSIWTALTHNLKNLFPSLMYRDTRNLLRGSSFGCLSKVNSGFCWSWRVISVLVKQ